MPTLAEIPTILENSVMQNKVTAALVVKCAIIIDNGSATTTQKEWAQETLASPGQMATIVWRYMIGTNDTATITEITTATDATIQTEVNSAVDALVA